MYGSEAGGSSQDTMPSPDVSASLEVAPRVRKIDRQRDRGIEG